MDEILMMSALVMSKRGTCSRGQVGVVVAYGGRILSTGYNGAPPGMPHCTHETFTVSDQTSYSTYHRDGALPSWLLDHLTRDTSDDFAARREYRILKSGETFHFDGATVTWCSNAETLPPTCVTAVHAEANAIAFAARNGVSLAGGWLYTTLAPCTTCALLLISAGITHVFALAEYRRSLAGVNTLRDAGVRFELLELGPKLLNLGAESR
jgi:dCMP deaminase